jgi:hypothetical protein
MTGLKLWIAILILFAPAAVLGSMGSVRFPFPRTQMGTPLFDSAQRHISRTDHNRPLVKIPEKKYDSLARFPPRGGQDANALVKIVGTIVQILISGGKMVLPPVMTFAQFLVGFYRSLPMDAIIAQIGLVYCFAGGYYPTLFSSLQAAQHCGWPVMIAAIRDLTEEAIKAIDELTAAENASAPLSRRDLYLENTNIVLKTVDPMKVGIVEVACLLSIHSLACL